MFTGLNLELEENLWYYVQSRPEYQSDSLFTSLVYFCS